MFNYKKVLFLYIVLLIVGIFSIQTVSAADYYMRSDGTAVDKSSATSCSDASTSMSVSTHNSSTFSAGDNIYICDTGGDYSVELTIPSSGTSANPISYIGVGSSTWNMSGRNWYTNTKDNNIILNSTGNYSLHLNGTDNLIFRNSTSTAASGIFIQNSNTTTIEDSTISSTGTNKDAIWISGGANYTITNLNVTSSLRYGIYLQGVYGSNTISDSSINNTIFQGINIINQNNTKIYVSNTTLTNVGTNGGAQSSGINYDGLNKTNLIFDIDNVEINNASGFGGFYIINAPFETTRGLIKNTTVDNSDYGIYKRFI